MPVYSLSAWQSVNDRHTTDLSAGASMHCDYHQFGLWYLRCEPLIQQFWQYDLRSDSSPLAYCIVSTYSIQFHKHATTNLLQAAQDCSKTCRLIYISWMVQCQDNNFTFDKKLPLSTEFAETTMGVSRFWDEIWVGSTLEQLFCFVFF